MYEKKPLIIWKDDNDKVVTTYSEYSISEGMIIFETNDNKISLPICRIIKIKEVKDDSRK